MGRRKLKADLLAELLYCRDIFNKEEHKQARLAIKAYFNSNHLPLNKSPEFYKMYDFCADYLIPCSKKAGLFCLMFERTDR